MTTIRFRLHAVMWALACAILSAQNDASTQSPNINPDLNRIRGLILEELGPLRVPSMAIAVVRDGQIIWEEGFGWADRERQVLATAHTPYYLASVTKAITGTAVTVLARRGRLDLDRPANDYLGRNKIHSRLWNADEATVLRLANHTAGLTTYARNCERLEQCSIDETIKRYAVLVRPAGAAFDYSNLGYAILGDVIARASRRSYSDFLREEIFQPLGMQDCSVAAIAPPQNAAIQYDSGSKERSPARVSGSVAASAVYCSVHDLALFSALVLKSPIEGQKAILPPTVIDDMLSSTVAADRGLRYNMGWWIQEDYFGYRSAFGSGGTTDSSAVLRLIPSERVAVAILSNTGTAVPQRIADEIFSELLPPFRERRAQPSAPSIAPAPRPEPIPMVVGTWRGVIRTPQGNRRLLMSVAPSGDVQAALESDTPAPFARGGGSGRRVYGYMSGDLRVDEAPRPPYDLEVGVELTGHGLVGSVTTRARPGQSGPALSYFVELRKMSRP